MHQVSSNGPRCLFFQQTRLRPPVGDFFLLQQPTDAEHLAHFGEGVEVDVVRRDLGGFVEAAGDGEFEVGGSDAGLGGEVEVDFAAHRLTRAGEAMEVTALEMKLLRYFVEHAGVLLPRQRILDAVWGADYFGTDRTVDNFVTRLRAKIEADPRAPRHLETVRGGGYRFTR